MTHFENSKNAPITVEQYQELRQARISQELERRALGTGNRIRVVVGALDAIEEDLSRLKVGASPIMEDFDRVTVLLKDLHAFSGTKKKL